MNFLALLLGLLVERTLTHLFHLREFRWLDGIFDRGLDRAGQFGPMARLLVVAVLGALLTLPVALGSAALGGFLAYIPQFLFSILVLLFCLGPRDLAEEVDELCAAAAGQDSEGVRRLSKELMERDPPDDTETLAEDVASGIFVQADNRIFGVVFWFLILGPTGAWLFRVMDLMRRRATYRYGRLPEGQSERLLLDAVRALHGILAWLPARLLAAGYVLAGDFDRAASRWRNGEYGVSFYDATESLLARVGHGAMPPQEEDQPVSLEARARTALRLVVRTLWFIWCPVIALLTLYNWVV